jgi:hypothetical protein
MIRTPTNIQVATFTLSWTNTSTSYELQYKENDATTVANSFWTEYGDYGSDATVTVEPDFGQSYQFRLIALGSGGHDSAASNVVTTAQPGPQPAGYLSLSGQWASDAASTYSTAGCAIINVSWTYSDAGNDWLSNDNWSLVQKGIAFNIGTPDISTESGPDENGVYSFTGSYNTGDFEDADFNISQPFVIQYSGGGTVDVGDGWPSYSNAVVATLPGLPVGGGGGGGGGGSAPNAPSNLTAAWGNDNDTSIDLEWDDNSDNETGFDIYESTDGGVTFTQVGEVGADDTSYVLQLSGGTGTGGALAAEPEAGPATQPTPSTTKPTPIVKVNAHNTTGTSGYSNNASANAGQWAIVPGVLVCECFDKTDGITGAIGATHGYLLIDATSYGFWSDEEIFGLDSDIGLEILDTTGEVKANYAGDTDYTPEAVVPQNKTCYSLVVPVYVHAATGAAAATLAATVHDLIKNAAQKAVNVTQPYSALDHNCFWWVDTTVRNNGGVFVWPDQKQDGGQNPDPPPLP